MTNQTASVDARRAGPWVRLQQLLSLLRTTSFDLTTEEGRSKERYRRAAITSLVALGARGVTIVTTLVTVPLTLSYLGPERYGMWMTISSVIAMLSFTDLGIGNGLLNSVAEANGRDDPRAAAKFVSSAMAMLAALAATIGAVFLLAYPWIPWQHVFNVRSATAIAEAGPGMAAFVVLFLIAMPLSVVQQTRIGYQEGYANSIFVGAGNLLALVLVLAAVAMRQGLPILVLAMAGAPVALTIVHGALLFGRVRPALRPRKANIDAGASRQIMRVGMMFLVLQLAVAVGFSSNSMIAAQIIGAGAVAEYAVATKLFLIPTMIPSLVLGPLWPAYREALIRGDASWVRRTLRRSLKVVLITVAPMAAAICIAAPFLIHIWVGNSVAPSLSLIVGSAVWTVLAGIGVAASMFLNGAQIIRYQVVVAAAMATVNIALSVALTQQIGVAGVVWGSVIAYSLCSLMPLVFLMPRLIAAAMRQYPAR